MVMGKGKENKLCKKTPQTIEVSASWFHKSGSLKGENFYDSGKHVGDRAREEIL